jgi:hypothetical protein
MKELLGSCYFKHPFTLKLLLIISVSCSHPPLDKEIYIKDKFFEGQVHINKNAKLDRFCLSIKNSKTGVTDKIYTPYEVFQMECGDINGDGRTDICLGIIKPTPFDPVIRKRLFIFQIDRDYIRPLWLSSRLANPLEEFRILKNNRNKYFIRAMGKEGNKYYCVTDYEWGSFGMVPFRNIGNSLAFKEAKNALWNK